MIGIVVRFDCADEDAASRFDRLTAEVVTATARHEPGTIVYATQTLVSEPLARVFYEVYADDAALQAHEDAQHVRAFHAAKDPLLSRPPRVELFTPGPATGLPAIPGVHPQESPGSHTGPPSRVEVDGEVFELRPDGRGGTQYTWLTGPNADYGFATTPSPTHDQEHRTHIRGFLAMIDPATGYIGED